MTETALDLITKALKRIGVISGIETPSADLAADSLDRLNALMETWSTESLTVWVKVTKVLPLVANKPLYLIGPGATADVPLPYRPAWVDGVDVIYPGNQLSRPLIPYSEQEWMVHRSRWITASEPTHYFYGTKWPDGLLAVWPVYSGGSVTTVNLYLPEPFVGPATLTTVLDYPPGYSRALRDWLAIEMAPELGRPVDGALMASATDAKAQLQRVNHVALELSLPPEIGCGWDGMGTRPYDWRTGE